ncbi:MAG: tetratricopeptide repeat protein [Candidatus Acidiferrales bacterium]
MKRIVQSIGVLALLVFAIRSANGQQIGRYVPIPAGSDADHALTEINGASDPAQKLALIDKFSSSVGQGDMAIVADDLYVNYYIGQKNYDKAFEYGDKLFALDPDNLSNAVNMIRAASEKGDSEKLMAYGEKLPGILQRFKESPAPAGMEAEAWQRQKAATLESNKDNITYIEQAMYMVAYRTPNAAKRAALMAHFAQFFPDSPYANQALGVAAASYQQAQNIPKMLEVANGLLAKDPKNVGMLLLLSDYYSENGEQLDKAETSAKKAITLLASASKPEGVTDEQWQQQVSLQKGLALSSLGQVSIQKKENAQAVENFKSAAPLLKTDEGSYGRNQYRLGFALLNLKRNAEAKEAFTQAASVNSAYKGLAQAKLKTFAGASRH